MTQNGDPSPADNTVSSSSYTLYQLCDRCATLTRACWQPLPNFSKGYLFQVEDTEDLNSEIAEIHESGTCQGQVVHKPDSPWIHIHAYLARRKQRLYFHYTLDELRSRRFGTCHSCCSLWKLAVLVSSQLGVDISSMEADALSDIILLPCRYTAYNRLRFLVSCSRCFLPGRISNSEVSFWSWSILPLEDDEPESTLDNDDSKEKLKVIALDPGTSDISSVTLQRIRKWMSTCQDHHTHCQERRLRLKHLMSNQLPTRLLDIHDDRNVFVCESVGLPLSTEYATLSYRWGGDEDTRLTKDNYTGYTQGMELEKLPKTFRDAMIAARSIGLNYIWIDALCIIQDDKEDWGLEAGRMASVYLNGRINFAATASPGVHSGLFGQEHHPLAFNQLVANLNWTGTEALQGKFLLMPPREWRTRIIQSPLHKRGWVFQEGILAERTLHFASDQLRWSCYSTCMEETVANYIPNEEWVTEYRLTLDTSDLLAWTELVREYHRRQLTVREDILVAFGGIANAFGVWNSLDDSDYLAGLWRQGLPQQLLWYAGSASSRRPVPQGAAPSWSWASVRGPADYCHGFGGLNSDFIVNPYFQVTGNTIKPKFSSRYSQIASGTLHVKGIVHAVRLADLRYSKNRSPNWYENRVKLPWYFSITIEGRSLTSCRHMNDSRECASLRKVPPGKTTRKGRKAGTAGTQAAEASEFQKAQNLTSSPLSREWGHFHELLDNVEQYSGDEIHALFLPILCNGHSDKEKPRLKSVWGLLIQRVEGTTASYRRIGVLILYPSDPGTGDIADIPEWHSGGELPPETYKVEHGNRCYEFDLV